ncbi:hypothetical protein J7L06_02655 [Candidatus Bathyarchaeota archaeon]|nr:hypothetical protein [Candidatus Bathyarchaeota archaeon]
MKSRDVALRFIIEKYLPDMLINLSTAILIWLFGVLFFIPTALSIEPSNLPILVGLIVLTAFTFFLSKSVKGFLTIIPPLVDRLAKKVAQEGRKDRSTRFISWRTEKSIRAFVYSALIVIFYLLYMPLLSLISVQINGLVLIIVILWVLWILLKEIVLT